MKPLSKLRPGRINSFNELINIKEALTKFNNPISLYIDNAKEELSKWDIHGGEEYCKLQEMNIPYTDMMLCYIACSVLGEAGALMWIIQQTSTLYQPNAEIRKQVKKILLHLALAKYPMSENDRYSAEYYLLLADYHLGVFGRWKYMSYDTAGSFFKFVNNTYSQYKSVTEAKLLCCKILSSTADDPPSQSDLNNLYNYATQYKFCAITGLAFCLMPELPDKKVRKEYRKKAMTYLSMLKSCDLACFIDFLNYISENELLGEVGYKQLNSVREFKADSLSDTDWYGIRY